jgi:hypothetical protein
MTDETKKTAVEQMFQEMLEIQQSGKTLTFDENLLLLEKYKEMEKQQHGKTWDTTATITNITHFCEVFEPAYKPSPTVATIIPCKKCGKSLWQHAKWTNTI